MLLFCDVDGVVDVEIDWATYKLANWTTQTNSSGLWEGLRRKSSCAKDGTYLHVRGLTMLNTQSTTMFQGHLKDLDVEANFE